jgi:hypothetical protein
VDCGAILCPAEVAATTRTYARPDIHIGADEASSPRIEVFPCIFVRFLNFDVRNNSFSNITISPFVSDRAACGAEPSLMKLKHLLECPTAK